MTNISQILEEELAEAFEVKNDKALKRYVGLLLESLMERDRAEKQFIELRSDIKVIAETMQEGFRQIDKRFEQIDKRFEQVDKRFEQVEKRFEQVDKRFEQVDKRFEQVEKRFEQVDKRFEDMYHYMDKRFEQVDKRFEDLYHFMDKRFEQVDKRFEDLNKRIGFMSWFTPTIVTLLLTLVMAAMKFL